MAGAAAKDIIARRYRLMHELGKGGMGTVWKAHDDRLNRAVALKLMAKRLLRDKTAVDRFEREAKAVARLLSPHIVQIYDYGIDPQPFMVMELLQGENLSQRLTREGQLPIDEVAVLMRQAARGLETAHEAGIVHRDLKPGNLFIVSDRDAEYVKVVDFGIAKAVRRQVTLTAITTHNQPVGTPQYMSPHQLKADEDSRDDIWALAVIAYKALSAVHPFASDSLVTLVQRILDDPHVPVTEYEPSLPAGIDAVFDRAFDKDRDKRFQSAGEFADALEALVTITNTSVPDIAALPARRTSQPAMPAAIVDSTPPPPTAALPSGPYGPPPVYASEDEESTTQVTLPRTSQPPTLEVEEDLAPTVELSEISDAVGRSGNSWEKLNALNLPTPTPPPAAGTPWPTAQVNTAGRALKPIVTGVALSLLTVGIAAWLLLPGESQPGNMQAAQPSAMSPTLPLPENPDTPLPGNPDTTPPTESENVEPALGEPDASATPEDPADPVASTEPKTASAPVPRPTPPSRTPATNPAPRTAPPPVPAKKRKKKKKKSSGDEAFERGPF